jgi:hypothetical protein
MRLSFLTTRGASPVAVCARQCAREGGVRLRRWRYRATGNGTMPRTLLRCTSTGAMETPTLWPLDGGPHTAVYITTASCPSTGAVACRAGHRVRLHHDAPLANGHTPAVSGWSARMVNGSPTPYRPRVGRPTRRLPWGATQLWSIPATASGPRHDAAVPPSCLPTRRDSSLGVKPGQQRRVFDVGLAPEVHDWELARAQQAGKRLRTHTQPSLRFGEGNQLRRRGDLQGEFLLARQRPCPGASRRRWHTRGFPSQVQGVRRNRSTRTADPSGLGRHLGDSTGDLC